MEVKFLYQCAIGQLKLVKWALMEKFSPGLKRSIFFVYVFVYVTVESVDLQIGRSCADLAKIASNFARSDSAWNCPPGLTAVAR